MPKKQTKRSKAQTQQTQFRQVVLTLNEATGEIASLEGIGPAGKRHALSDSEIAKIAGDNELDDFSEVLEDAYAAGIRDGLDDALSNHDSPTSHADLDSAGSQILQSGIRRFILRRALRRSAARSQLPRNGVHDTR
jgi:hypothetical protein